MTHPDSFGARSTLTVGDGGIGSYLDVNPLVGNAFYRITYP